MYQYPLCSVIVNKTDLSCTSTVTVALTISTSKPSIQNK